MTNDLIHFYFFGIVDRAILYLIDLPALNTGDVVMMVIAMNSRTQSVMLFAVKLLDPRQDAAFNEALKIAVTLGSPHWSNCFLSLPHTSSGVRWAFPSTKSSMIACLRGVSLNPPSFNFSKYCSNNCSLNRKYFCLLYQKN